MRRRTKEQFRRRVRKHIKEAEALGVELPLGRSHAAGDQMSTSEAEEEEPGTLTRLDRLKDFAKSAFAGIVGYIVTRALLPIPRFSLLQANIAGIIVALIFYVVARKRLGY